MTPTKALERSRRPWVRGCILRAVADGEHLGATDAMCRNVAITWGAGCTMQRIRLEMEYLEAGGLVTLERSEIRPWKERLTRAGRDVTDYTVEAPKGVERPPLAP